MTRWDVELHRLLDQRDTGLGETEILCGEHCPEWQQGLNVNRYRATVPRPCTATVNSCIIYVRHSIEMEHDTQRLWHQATFVVVAYYVPFDMLVWK